jgi:hypothetical protein
MGCRHGKTGQRGQAWDAADIRRPFLGPCGTGVAAVDNTGASTHEVMTLPLNANQYPGQRADGTQ